MVFSDPTLRLVHVDTRVISKIQERLERDLDALKRVLQSFGITEKTLLWRNLSSIFQFFPDTPVTMLKDVFEALQLYDLLELLESKSAIKPHRSLQLAYTLDEIKKLNGVADLPTTYHSCGAVLIITGDENVSSASAIKTLFTDLDNKSDVTEILTQEIPTLRHLNEEINGMILEINGMILEISARFGNLSVEGKTRRQTEVLRSFFLPQLKDALPRLKDALEQLKLRIRQMRSTPGEPLFILTPVKRGISVVEMELKRITFIRPSEGKTELRQNDELARFLQSMMVTAERIQANLTKLIQNPEWFVIEDEKEKKNFQENVSAVINRWIHRQG